MFFKKRRNKILDNIKRNPLPNHLAIIMDGNGRWAKRRGLPRTAGHNEGGKALLKIVKVCNMLNIKALTVYAFSTENWKRPKDEVEFLMKLPTEYIEKYLPMIKKENIRFNFIGHLANLSEEMKANIAKAIEETKNNTGLVFTIALNYGSQSEIISAVKAICNDCFLNKLKVDEITEQVLASKLMTADLPQVDLLIRTSGEMRLSNFLLWQVAYSEFYFTKKLWPDFDENELYFAIKEYQNRHRRYGGL